MKTKKDLYRKLFNIANDVSSWEDFHSKEEIRRRNNNLLHQCILLLDALPDSAIQLLCESPKCSIMSYTDFTEWNVLINFSWYIDFSKDGEFDLGNSAISIDIGPKGILGISNKSFDANIDYIKFAGESVTEVNGEYPIDLTKIDIQWPKSILLDWGLGVNVLNSINKEKSNAF